MPDLLKISGISGLVKYAASGVGAVAGPILADWRASKEGKARLTSAQYDAKIRVVEAEAQAQALGITSEAQFKALRATDQEIEGGSGRLAINRADIDQMIEFQSYKRLANTSAAIEGAAEDLADKEVPNHDPDPDWTARFFDCVKDVSSEDMQKLWARILSGEIESPGRTSLRTLDTLRNMTVSDARMFEAICPFIIGDGFIFDDDTVKGLNDYNTLLHLQDCGLVSITTFLTKSFFFNEEGNNALFNQNATLMISRDQNSIESVDVPAVLITASGKELYGIVDCILNQEYLRAFANFLKNENCRLYLLDGVVELPGDRIRFSSQIPIEP